MEGAALVQSCVSPKTSSLDYLSCSAVQTHSFIFSVSKLEYSKTLASLLFFIPPHIYIICQENNETN